MEFIKTVLANFNVVLEFITSLWEAIQNAYIWCQDAVLSFLGVIASYRNVWQYFSFCLPSSFVAAFSILLTVSIGFAVLSFFGSSVRG